MKLNTYVLLSLTGILTPGTTNPIPASVDTAVRAPGTMKRENPSFEAAISKTAVVDIRDIPSIEVQIRDPARIEGRAMPANIETRDIPSIEVQIRDPARIEGREMQENIKTRDIPTIEVEIRDPARIEK